MLASSVSPGMWQDVPAHRVEVGDRILVAPGQERQVVAIRTKCDPITMPPESKGDPIDIRHAPTGNTRSARTEDYYIGSEDLVSVWLT